MTFTFTAQIGSRVGDAFVAAFGLAEGETPTQLVHRKIIDFMKGVVSQQEANLAGATAVATAQANADATVVIT